MNLYLSEVSLSKSLNTLRLTSSILKIFISWLELNKVRNIKSVKPAHVVSYLSYRKDLGSEGASLSIYFSSIKVFFSWLRQNNEVEVNVCENIDAPKRSKKMPRVPTREQINRMITLPDCETWEGLRDRALLELMYSSGLRASEICGLQKRDIAENSVHVSSGKGGKTRTVPLTLMASKYLKKYMETLDDQSTESLFVTVQGKVFSRHALVRSVKAYARLAEISDCTPHTLRHACATHLLESGADIRLIQEVLGHASISSTQRYTQLTSAKTSQMFNEFHPRAANE